MELRRPGLEDKEAVIDLILEFERSNAAHDGGFWDKENFVYEDWIAGNQDAEMGLNIPNTWVPAIQFVAFDKGQAVGFLNLRLRLNEHLRGHGGHIGYSIPGERLCDRYVERRASCRCFKEYPPSASYLCGGQFC